MLDPTPNHHWLSARGAGRLRIAARGMILYEQGIKFKLSGDEVYYTACSLLVISRNSCSKLHRQHGFNLIIFSYKVTDY